MARVRKKKDKVRYELITYKSRLSLQVLAKLHVIGSMKTILLQFSPKTSTYTEKCRFEYLECCSSPMAEVMSTEWPKKITCHNFFLQNFIEQNL